MPKVSKNLLTEGWSGTFGKQIVFRNVKGRIITSSRPVKTAEATEAQLTIRDRFFRATRFAKNAVKDSILKLLYTAKSDSIRSPYNVAIADYFNPPVIDSVSTENYHGAVNDTILFKAYDDVEIKAVKVEIRKPDSSLIESGYAEINEAGEFVYTATGPNPELAGSKITVKVTDNPGNETVQEITL